MITQKTEGLIEIDPELVIICEFIAECAYQGEDVTPEIMLAACHDTLARLNLAEPFRLYRDARAD